MEVWPGKLTSAFKKKEGTDNAEGQEPCDLHDTV